MSYLGSRAKQIAEQVEYLLSNASKCADRSMPCHTFFLDGGEVRWFKEISTFIENAAAGDLLHLEMDSGSEARLDVVFGCPADAEAAEAYAAEVIDPDLLDEQCEEHAGQRSFELNGESAQGERDEVMGIEKLWVPYDFLGKGPVNIRVRQ